MSFPRLHDQSFLVVQRGGELNLYLLTCGLNHRYIVVSYRLSWTWSMFQQSSVTLAVSRTQTELVLGWITVYYISLEIGLILFWETGTVSF